MSLRLDGNNPLSYMGVTPLQPPQMWVFSVDPTINDFSNVGSFWLNIGTNQIPLQRLWLLVSVRDGIALWIQLGTGFGTVITLETNSGGLIPPTAGGNIFVVGDGTTIVGVGVPGSNTITLSAVNTGTVSSLTADDGHIVTPTAGTIIIHGTNGITTTGTIGPNTVTITAGGSIAQSFPTDSGTATPAAGVLNIIANHAALNCGSSVEFTGAGNTVTLNVTDANSSVIIGSGSGNLTMAGSAGTSVGLGPNVLSSLTTGGAQTAVGWGALRNCTTGFANCAFGNLSLDNCVGGGSNSAGGFQSMRLLTSGSHNTGFGENVLFSVLSGSYNCALGGNGTAGAYAGAESSNITVMNSGVLGESNTMRLGTSGAGNGQVSKAFIAGIAGVTTGVADAVGVLISASTGQLGTVSSSARYKENIVDIGPLSDDLHLLRPVVFNYKNHSPQDVSYGLIAEEVDKLFPELVVRDKEGRPDTIKYHELPILLLNEIIKLKKEIQELRELI